MILSRSLAVALVLLTTASAEAQVLTIGETQGKGKNGILVSDTIVLPADGNNAFGQFSRGLSERFDLYLAGGAATTAGSTQGWLGAGGTLRLARAGKASVALFNLATVPLNRREQACQLLWNPAVVVSAPASKALTLYTGVNALVPIGDRARGVFTPTSTKVNVPIGATYAIGAWGLWGEVDFGNLNTAGIGLTKLW